MGKIRIGAVRIKTKNDISKKAILRISTSIPSSTSTLVSNDDDESIERTPSGPTFSIASAIMVPTNSSFPADIAATAELKRQMQSFRIHILQEMVS
jgi:hypothetical protein